MAIEGKLGPGGVADLLGALWHAERTAIVDVTVGGVERRLVLDAGAVVYLTSADAAEKLAVRLVSEGAASREQLVRASKAGGDLRKALEAAGADPAGYDRVLRSLIEEAIAKVFPRSDGQYAIHDRTELELTGLLEDLDMTALLWSQARACPPEFAERFLGNLGSRLVKTGHDEVLQELRDLSPQEGFLLSRIDGYGAAADLFTLLPLPREQVLRFLVGLVLVGYAEVQGRPGLKLPKPAKPSGKRKKAAPAPSAKAGSTTSRIVSTAGAIPSLQSAAPAAPAAPEPELEGIDAARALQAKVKDLDHYGVLGVTQAAGEEDVRKSYYRLARLYHPDRFGKDLAGKDREVVEDLFGRISEAFATLSTPDKRQEYDARLKSGAIAAEKAAEKPVDKKDLARMSFEKGKALVTMGDRSRALSFFEHAAETDPESWDYRIALARLLMTESRLRKRAEQQLHAAIEIDRTKAESYLLLGTLYKLGGVKSRALEQLREGLRWDPQNEAILKEIAELDEKGPEAAGGGLLGGLFKKK